MSQEHLKNAPGFEENTSLVRRLKAIMIAVILLILLGVLGLYLSSQPLLDGLRQLNAANLTMTSITVALDGLDTSEKELNTLLEGSDLKDSQFMLKESQQLFNMNLNNAFVNGSGFSEVKVNLTLALENEQEFENQVSRIFKRLTSANARLSKEELSAEILVAHQYLQDAREALRKSFLLTKQQSDEIFLRIYEARFGPMVAAIILSTIFLGFVIIFGFSITKRLRLSLANLAAATKKVTKGDFTHRARIHHADEIGHLTHTFNQMVEALDIQKQKLEATNERILSLQEITASFSEALTPEQVFNIIMDKGLKTVGASAGVIGTISEDGSSLEIQRVIGYSFKFEGYKLSAPFPMGEAIRYGRPYFMGNKQELLAHFPNVRNRNVEQEAHAVLPLQIGSETLGALSFSYPDQKTFHEDEKKFLIALTRQSAQALHRSQLFENAKKAIQTRDEFLSIASHELKTPLTPLKLHLQGLARHVKKDKEHVSSDKLIKIVETSDKQITRLARLIEDLLDVSRINSGKLNLSKEYFNLSQMVQDVVKQYAEHLRNVQSEIIVTADPHVEGFMDRVRIEQVLINFLTNAGKYAPGKTIHISLTQQDGFAQLAVKDEGPGIRPEDQARIFDRFERVKNKDNIGGLGLGLYISKQIIEAHGGNIRVESITGNGATFIAEIPLHHVEPHAAVSENGRYL